MTKEERATIFSMLGTWRTRRLAYVTLEKLAGVEATEHCEGDMFEFMDTHRKNSS